MSLIDRLLATECGGENTGLYQLIRGLMEGEPQVTLHQATGLARAIRYVLSRGDEKDVQLAVGSAYLRELTPLVESSGRAWLSYQQDHALGGHRPWPDMGTEPGDDAADAAGWRR